MSVPFLPTPQSSPIVNPAAGSTGSPPIPLISNSQFLFYPTAVSGTDLVKGATDAQNAQALADRILEASRWADSICFGQEVSDAAGSLCATLVNESATIRIKGGELRLMCNSRPLVQLVGVAVGSGLNNISDLDSSIFAAARPGQRTWYVPYGGGLVTRSGDAPYVVPGASGYGGWVYAVWSHVTGYPHTKLLADVAANATTCVVASTDGNGGLWGVFAASGAFPGTQLRVVDQGVTESIFVKSIAVNTPSAGQTTLTTSAFSNAHTVPAAPDFIPVTAIPETVAGAVAKLTACLVKTRGSRAMVMSPSVGGRPTKTAMGQAGVLGDYDTAKLELADAGVIIRLKRPGSY